MSAANNLMIAQSGGPSPVINNTLRGIVEAALDLSAFDHIYAAQHGIEGLLNEALLDLSNQSPREIALLRTTPAAGAIGTCRYKLKPEQQEDYQRCLDVLQAHQIGYFIYIGGNDSMDTAHKIAELAHQRGLDLVAVGAPKTIDNDLGDAEFQLIDHTPGYGSCARYWMHAVQYANEENRGSAPADPVLVLQAMGRRIGFIPAAARLADPNREFPLQIYLAERPVRLAEIADQVNDQLKQCGRALVVVSEGLQVGQLGEVKDAFGHTQFSSSQTTVAQLIVNYLNQAGLPCQGKARANVPGTDQRHSMAYASAVDLEEAYRVGQAAAELAANRKSGQMATIHRRPQVPYQVSYGQVPLKQVALSERTFPSHWISADGLDVSDDFVQYAMPLVGDEMIQLPMEGGRQRLARLEPLFAKQQLPSYVPQALRDGDGTTP